MQETVHDSVRVELEHRRSRLAKAAARTGDTSQLRALISEVDAALGRLQAGTFGRCEVCQDPIEHDLLMADPLTRTCLAHLSPGEQRALEQDLDLAGRIQVQLLPRPALAVPGWEIAYHFEPAGTVGGDYCDVILSETILMANLHATFRSLADAGLPVEALMARANRLFCQSTLDTHYATLVCGRAAPSGEIDVVNAGHWPALVVRRDRVETVGATGVPLGLFCASEYRPTRVALAPGELLVLHTDGLSEARNPAGDDYGTGHLTARLADLAAAGDRDPHRVATACLGDLAAFRDGLPLEDDLTLMVVRRAG
jgi:sigma-B regulation protein RsbU (phosphoserine phosphatase)